MLSLLKISFKIEMMENGNLYGRPIDILYRASSLIILALGMTFVIATGGIDISVGAVVAISAATCCTLLGGDISGVPQHPVLDGYNLFPFNCRHRCRLLEWLVSCRI